jgi:hypothetical protein
MISAAGPSLYRARRQPQLGYKSLLQAHIAQAEFKIAESGMYAAGQPRCGSS